MNTNTNSLSIRRPTDLAMCRPCFAPRYRIKAPYRCLTRATPSVQLGGRARRCRGEGSESLVDCPSRSASYRLPARLALLRRALDPLEDFWTSLLRSLRTGGLNGVKLVMSDAHSGLKNAVTTIFQGAGWQRCWVPFMRNVRAAVPKGGQDMVASIIRTIFARPRAKHIAKQCAEVTTINNPTETIGEVMILPELAAA